MKNNKLILLSLLLCLFSFWGCSSDNNTGIGGSGSDDRSITEFKIGNKLGIIDQNKLTITIKVPEENLSDRMTPTIKISEGAKVVPASDTEVDFSEIIFYQVTSEDGSKRVYKAFTEIDDKSLARINAFTIKAEDFELDLEVDQEAFTITGSIPFGTDITKLEAILSMEAGSVSPEQGDVVDFSKPVIYSVISKDGTRSQDYEVSIGMLPNSKAEITALEFEGIELSQEAIIDHKEGYVIAYVPSGTDLSSLKSSLEFSENASITIEGNQDYSKPVKYNLQSEDRTEKRSYYIYTVHEDAEPQVLSYVFKDINQVTLPSRSEIDHDTKTIKCIFIKGTTPPLTKLTPTVLTNNVGVFPAINEPLNYNQLDYCLAIGENGAISRYSIIFDTETVTPVINEITETKFNVEYITTYYIFVKGKFAPRVFDNFFKLTDPNGKVTRLSNMQHIGSKAEEMRVGIVGYSFSQWKGQTVEFVLTLTIGSLTYTYPEKLIISFKE